MANQILSNLIGPDVHVSEFKTPKDQQKRPSASARAMTAIQNIILTHGIAEAARQAQSIQAEYPRNAQNPGFDPWSAWERQHLTNLYKTDVARLSKDPRITMIGPDII